jgi:hypothetical protein
MITAQSRAPLLHHVFETLRIYIITILRGSTRYIYMFTVLYNILIDPAGQERCTAYGS